MGAIPSTVEAEEFRMVGQADDLRSPPARSASTVYNASSRTGRSCCRGLPRSARRRRSSRPGRARWLSPPVAALLGAGRSARSSSSSACLCCCFLRPAWRSYIPAPAISRTGTDVLVGEEAS